ncbi:hypothetical protein CWD78_16380 [Dickeya dadantii]|nr:hypothetical protein [Dickeya dadantii]
MKVPKLMVKFSNMAIILCSSFIVVFLYVIHYFCDVVHGFKDTPCSGSGQLFCDAHHKNMNM